MTTSPSVACGRWWAARYTVRPHRRAAGRRPRRTRTERRRGRAQASSPSSRGNARSPATPRPSSPPARPRHLAGATSPSAVTPSTSIEHTAADAAGGQFRLSRFDIATGDEQWSREVGPSASVDAYDDIVVVSDKSHFEVYDAATGALRFERDGSVADVNRYGTLLLADGSVVTALDPVTGEVRWEADGALGAFCRDIVIVVAPIGDDTGRSALRRPRPQHRRRALDESRAVRSAQRGDHVRLRSVRLHHRRRRVARVGCPQRLAQLVGPHRRTR